MLINNGECVAYSRRPGLKLEVQERDPQAIEYALQIL